MAKRKRLTLPDQTGTPPARAPETKSMFIEGPVPDAVRVRLAGRSAPIADMAGAASAAAALEEVSAELSAARAEGRLVQKLRFDQIDAGHLMRDRVVIDTGDMETLMASIRARGQQTPVEVLETGPDSYGLISGWRRLAALARLYEETRDPRFALVQALIRRPEGAQEAYVAMVEENEIRVGLSYYERAQIVARTVQAGVYDSDKTALQTLFSAASRAKRSKIKSFLPIVRDLGAVLQHPAAIGERMGLDLSQRLAEPELAERFRAALEDGDGRTAEEEQDILSGLIAATSDAGTPPAPSAAVPAPEKSADRPPAPPAEEIAPGLRMTRQGSSLTLRGTAVTDDLVARLRDFLSEE